MLSYLESVLITEDYISGDNEVDNDKSDIDNEEEFDHVDQKKSLNSWQSLRELIKKLIIYRRM